MPFRPILAVQSNMSQEAFFTCTNFRNIATVAGKL